MATVEKFDKVNEMLEKKGKSEKDVINELTMIAFNQRYFQGKKRDKYYNLKDKLEKAEENLEYKENILERSESYKMTMKNKIENMEEKIEEKRSKLLEELGSSL